MSNSTKTSRDEWLKKRYGINSIQWLRMFNLQNGKCPICLKVILKPGSKSGKRAASVDHDHITKRVRGLLCYRCNRFVIGRNRTPDKMKRVVAYLESTFDAREL